MTGNVAKSETQIVNDIDNYIRQCDGVYAAWYVGIAANPEDRLFSDHNVQRQGNAWIYRTAPNSDAARRTEQHFLRLGCDGGTGGGDWQTRAVYAYKKTKHTRP